MNKKLVDLAQTMINAIEKHNPMGDFIESTDARPTLTDDDKVEFTMTQSLSVTDPTRRGPGSHTPVGHHEYTVTIVHRFVKFDDE